jgi:4-oxalocrotonate tautomerase
MLAQGYTKKAVRLQNEMLICLFFIAGTPRAGLEAARENHDSLYNGGVQMPYVNIRVAGTLSRKQKKKIAKGVTKVISEAAGKPRESILIFIDEEQRQNIAKGGRLLDE